MRRILETGVQVVVTVVELGDVTVAIVVTVTVIVAVTVTGFIAVEWCVREEVEDEKDASRTKTVDQPTRRQLRIFKVVETEADSGHVEVFELWARERSWERIGRVRQVANHRKHVILRETLGRDRL